MNLREIVLGPILVVCLGTVLVAGAATAANQSVTLCHVPPGDPLNAHEIVVSEKAIPAHIANHPDDRVGTCPEGCDSVSDCSDADLCTRDVCNPDGTCDNSEQVDCDDGNVCTIDACDPSEGCMNVQVGNEPPVACDDGDACTNDDFCDGVTCTGTPSTTDCCESDADCEPSDACTTRYCEDTTRTCQEVDRSSLCQAGACEVAYCDPVDGCLTESVTCPDDGDICTVAECDPLICAPSGNCVTRPVETPPGTEDDDVTCNDGLDNDCDGLVDLNDPQCCNEDDTLIFLDADFKGSFDLVGANSHCEGVVASAAHDRPECCGIIVSIDPFLCFNTGVYTEVVCDELQEAGSGCQECIEFDGSVNDGSCEQCKINLEAALLDHIYNDPGTQQCQDVFIDCPTQ